MSIAEVALDSIVMVPENGCWPSVKLPIRRQAFAMFEAGSPISLGAMTVWMYSAIACGW